MPRSPNHRLKVLYVMNFLLHNSDEGHPVTMRQIIDHLESNGISAERKSIYDDIDALRDFGLDIVQVASGRNHCYFVANRDFELPELKLLVDSVQSSKFITRRKTHTLIRKIEQLASIHEAQLLNRQVFVLNRVKSVNEAIYYNVDAIHDGIAKNKKIQFHYFEYTVEKQKRYRRDGAFYVMSPFAMCWDDENYYLVAYDSEMEIIKHFRVDKMDNITVLEEDRDGAEAYAAIDMAVYAKKVFGMFSGEEVNVQMRFENHLVGAVMDRLGHDVFIVADGDDHFTVRANVVVSPQFFAWISGFGASVQVIGPDDVVEEMAKHVRAVAHQYDHVQVKTEP